MDIMMVLSTDDVKRLKNKFVRPLSVDEFVFIMIKCLHDHIHNELEFVMSVIELYETIDVNGDGSLEWDEFAGYIVDAGIAKAEEAIVAQSTIKLYSPLVFKGGAANSIQPMVADRTYIQQVAILAGRQALAYFEHGSDVVHIYLFGHDRDAEPRFASTIRLHTAYQAHKVLCIEDIATRSSLAISSLLTMGCITLWDVTRLYNPIPLQRIDLTVPQETLTWVPSHQLLLVATTQSTYKKASKKQHPFAFVTAFDIATLERVPLDVGIKHVTSLCVVKRSTRTAVALGSMDGTITVHDMAKESQQRRHDIVVDAHEKGVKALAYSVKFGYLASIGHYSFAEESTMEVLVWHFDDGDNATSTVRLDRALSGHHAALCAITAVDCESHLVSSDESGVLRVWSVSTWACLQTFHTLHVNPLRCQVVWPTSPQADALLLCVGKSVEFHDCALVREREDFLFVDFNATFNVILAATYHRLILWDLATGDVRKTYELHVIYHGRPAHSITAVCLDDRERKLIVGDDVGQVLVVNVVNGNLMKELDPHAQAISSLAYVARAKCVVSTAVDSTIHICDENNAHGYYVPFAGAPLSVLLRSLCLSPTAAAPLRHHPRRDTIAIAAPITNATSTPDMDIVTSVSSDALRLVATVSSCSIGESYIQLWDFDTSALVQTCIAPDPTADISCVAFLQTYPGLVAGVSTGDVYLWGVRPSPGAPAASTQRCLFQLVRGCSPRAVSSQPSTSPGTAISSILTVPDPASGDSRGVMVFAGDEAGEVVRWTLPYSAVVESGLSVRHSNNMDDNDDGDDASAETTFVTAVPAARPSTAKRNSTPTFAPAVASAAPANPGRHTHVDVTWDTMSKSIRTAKLSTIAAPPQSVGSDVQWQVDGGAITKLARAICTEDKLTIFTCVATGKIQAWSVDGNDQGTLDYFATRRQPVHAPWRVPVDGSLRQRAQEARAKAVLQQVRGVTALLQNMDGKGSNTYGPTSVPNKSKPSTPASFTGRLPQHSASSTDDVITPRTAARYQTLGQLVARKERRALRAPDDEESQLNASLDVVLHDIGKLNHVTRSTHARKKRTIHTVDSIMERSISMPALPPKAAASIKPDKPIKVKVPSKHLLPPLDLRQEMADLALLKQQEAATNSPDADNPSTLSVLSYHLKLAHAWQQ
ncbi:hypothetical protein H310_12161 [Aphanomyces invadans]|uniref:EF-hand domain-containing protein n=1 Tax=Aphanomyces invadans TaxID=157072 RepID=A0A024TKL9_9STRA|nr:hypothetical protein H310_12161 [Aphanomyces invadans]ETV94161.1 hypothetical protein H310_12161 [Aphanomyces invadans]|eukprot:XP_008877364.1 hypothetical protein H310_12161 [Aphanomyces invadans]